MEGFDGVVHKAVAGGDDPFGVRLPKSIKGNGIEASIIEDDEGIDIIFSAVGWSCG